MIHNPKCPAYGDPKWEDVVECGPCDYLAMSDPSARV